MIVPLINARKGESFSIHCMNCSCKEVCMLQDLGCMKGARGKVLSNQKNIILQIGESRIAISAFLAQSILVSLL
jgi:Fe2+ transport system protein FeoA